MQFKSQYFLPCRLFSSWRNCEASQPMRDTEKSCNVSHPFLAPSRKGNCFYVKLVFKCKVSFVFDAFNPLINLLKQYSLPPRRSAPLHLLIGGFCWRSRPSDTAYTFSVIAWRVGFGKWESLLWPEVALSLDISKTIWTVMMIDCKPWSHSLSKQCHTCSTCSDSCSVSQNCTRDLKRYQKSLPTSKYLSPCISIGWLFPSPTVWPGILLGSRLLVSRLGWSSASLWKLPKVQILGPHSRPVEAEPESRA